MEFPIYVKGAPGYRVRIYFGPEATAQDRAAARRIVASIRPVGLGEAPAIAGPTLQAIPDHGPVWTKVELLGSGSTPR